MWSTEFSAVSGSEKLNLFVCFENVSACCFSFPGHRRALIDPDFLFEVEILNSVSGERTFVNTRIGIIRQLFSSEKYARELYPEGRATFLGYSQQEDFDVAPGA